MCARWDRTEERDHRVQEWQLRLLRFAITRALDDRSTFIASAIELDSAVGLESSFTFFVRTSHQLCDAIVRTRDTQTASTLYEHAKRIDDPRLRAAFLASLDLKEVTSPRQRPQAAWRTRHDLWKGMPKR